MKWDVLLLNIEKIRRNEGLFHFPIGQHYIASFLNENGYTAKIYSGNLKNIENVISDAIESKRVKIIGFYCAYDNEEEVISLSRYIKETYPCIKIAIGGPQVIDFTEKEIKKAKCDVIIIGEGELTFLELVDLWIGSAGKLEKIKGIKFLKNGKLFITSHREVIENLDNLPFPDFKNSINLKKTIILPIITGRGCPFNCAFCYEATISKKTRFRSVENAMKEIDNAIKDNPDLKYIVFLDDTFTLNINRVKKFCQELKKRNKLWFCEAHVKILHKNPEIIPEMISAGLTRIQIGIESGNNEILKLYNKNITTDMIKEVVSNLVNYGISHITGNFIIGGPNESKESIKKSIDFAKELLNIAKGVIELKSVFLATYPGTEITKNPNKYGLKIFDKNGKYSLLSMIDCVVETKYLNKTNIYNAVNKFSDEITREMKKIIKRLSFERLNNLYNLHFNYSISSEWINLISKQFPEVHRYFYFLYECGFYHSSWIEKDLLNYKPIRNIMEKDYTEDGLMIMKRKKLNMIETEILKMCSGKFKLQKIIDNTKKKFDYSDAQVFRVINKLENNFLIFFSRF